MRKFFADLIRELTPVCPIFMHLPPRTTYPHMIVGDITSLRAIPDGPAVASFQMKIRSQYPGTREILNTLQAVEYHLHTFQTARIKVIKSSLSLLADGKTREHTLQLKARVHHA